MEITELRPETTQVATSRVSSHVFCRDPFAFIMGLSEEEAKFSPLFTGQGMTVQGARNALIAKVQKAFYTWWVLLENGMLKYGIGYPRATEYNASIVEFNATDGIVYSGRIPQNNDRIIYTTKTPRAEADSFFWAFANYYTQVRYDLGPLMLDLKFQPNRFLDQEPPYPRTFLTELVDTFHVEILGLSRYDRCYHKFTNELIQGVQGYNDNWQNGFKLHQKTDQAYLDKVEQALVEAAKFAVKRRRIPPGKVISGDFGFRYQFRSNDNINPDNGYSYYPPDIGDDNRKRYFDIFTDYDPRVINAQCAAEGYDEISWCGSTVEQWSNLEIVLSPVDSRPDNVSPDYDAPRAIYLGGSYSNAFSFPLPTDTLFAAFTNDDDSRLAMAVAITTAFFVAIRRGLTSGFDVKTGLTLLESNLQGGGLDVKNGHWIGGDGTDVGPLIASFTMEVYPFFVGVTSMQAVEVSGFLWYTLYGRPSRSWGQVGSDCPFTWQFYGREHNWRLSALFQLLCSMDALRIQGSMMEQSISIMEDVSPATINIYEHWFEKYRTARELFVKPIDNGKVPYRFWYRLQDWMDLELDTFIKTIKYFTEGLKTLGEPIVRMTEALHASTPSKRISWVPDGESPEAGSKKVDLVADPPISERKRQQSKPHYTFNGSMTQHDAFWEFVFDVFGLKGTFFEDPCDEDAHRQDSPVGPYEEWTAPAYCSEFWQWTFYVANTFVFVTDIGVAISGKLLEWGVIEGERLGLQGQKALKYRKGAKKLAEDHASSGGRILGTSVKNPTAVEIPSGEMAFDYNSEIIPTAASDNFRIEQPNYGDIENGYPLTYKTFRFRLTPQRGVPRGEIRLRGGPQTAMQYDGSIARGKTLYDRKGQYQTEIWTQEYVTSPEKFGETYNWFLGNKYRVGDRPYSEGGPRFAYYSENRGEMPVRMQKNYGTGSGRRPELYPPEIGAWGIEKNKSGDNLSFGKLGQQHTIVSFDGVEAEEGLEGTTYTTSRMHPYERKLLLRREAEARRIASTGRFSSSATRFLENATPVFRDVFNPLSFAHRTSRWVFWVDKWLRGNIRLTPNRPAIDYFQNDIPVLFPMPPQLLQEFKFATSLHGIGTHVDPIDNLPPTNPFKFDKARFDTQTFYVKYFPHPWDDRWLTTAIGRFTALGTQDMQTAIDRARFPNTAPPPPQPGDGKLDEYPPKHILSQSIRYEDGHLIVKYVQYSEDLDPAKDLVITQDQGPLLVDVTTETLTTTQYAGETYPTFQVVGWVTPPPVSIHPLPPPVDVNPLPPLVDVNPLPPLVDVNPLPPLVDVNPLPPLVDVNPLPPLVDLDRPPNPPSGGGAIIALPVLVLLGLLMSRK